VKFAKEFYGCAKATRINHGTIQPKTAVSVDQECHVFAILPVLFRPEQK